ncbi:MAG TPA: gluconate 2-dehydrogenase subunit 3 family protein [Dehalococcoidia bacterium]|jgi:hypothetical protein|nr:gluconate 2-dehydrogenase subunit 3 family protein [Dehalococcoidia bacterium]
MIEDRYPDADVLAQQRHWDEATRQVVLERVNNVPRFEYFDSRRQETLIALCERIIPQAHRSPERRVPIAPWIDRHCRTGEEPGYRYDDLPPIAEAWERGLDGIEQAAQALFGERFAELDCARQDAVLERVRRGDPPGDAWRTLPAQRWWISVVLRQIAGVYYAHPYAWDEIGFGGPAYPRGYFALNHGAPEPWEPREVGERNNGRNSR